MLLPGRDMCKFVDVNLSESSGYNKTESEFQLYIMWQSLNTLFEIREYIEDKLNFRTGSDIKNAPYHVFGEHNCSLTFCNQKESGEQNFIQDLEDCGILTEIRKTLQPLIMKADRLAFNKTTNQAERFMSLVTKIVGCK
ncbi:hypothetical protein RN001_005627 [Aquatica leii]|uniref:Uncharacterized protein n=1 Tax=Aquatica leii TaxID=1421715 RepID=A0AAN7PCZ1_9COLE|nr:hypothetical protein RN001_005627 [Aquatica leii]